MSAQNSKGLYVITVPKKINRCMEKLKKIERFKKMVLQNSGAGDTSVPILSCKNQKLNFYKGQSYGKFQEVSLASEGWKSRRSKGDFFTFNKYLENPAFLKTSSSLESFEELGLDTRVVQQLTKQGFDRPTNIQILAIPHILEGSNTLVAAETGNGKSMAFLAPIMHQVLNSKSHEEPCLLNSPRALIIVPGRELVVQTRDMARMIGFDLGVTVNSVVGGRTKKLMLNHKVRNTDILVGSFGCLSKLITNRIYKINRVSHVVLDEADTLLDDTFNEDVSRFLSKFAMSEKSDKQSGELSGIQLTLVGATFPKSIENILNKVIDMDTLVDVKTPYLHRISPHINQTFVRLNQQEKSERLLKLAKKNQNQRIPTIIFSNTAPTSDWVSMFLNENGIRCTNLNGAMTFYGRMDKFRAFRDEEFLFLSCTDVVSRGLDTVRAKHILNYDFPRFMADYIHRCGRTGRVGSDSDCHVTNFVTKKNEVALVQKIEYALRKVENLPSVNANIKRVITEKTKRYEEMLMKKRKGKEQ